MSVQDIESGKKVLQSLFRPDKYFHPGGQFKMLGKIITFKMIGIFVILCLFSSFEIARGR